MGIISKPHFDFKDLSASSHRVIYSYLSDENEDVPTEIRDAILDIYNDLLYAVQSGVRVILSGRAATPSTTSDDDFVADCVPGPLAREPVQFNVSLSNSKTSRHSAVSGLRSLKTRSVGSRRSLGRNISSGSKKIDSMIDPDSTVSLKRLSAASYSPGSPLRYSFSAIDIEDDISTKPTEHTRIGRRCSRVDLGAQMDGADDDRASARRQQYPSWLTAKALPVTPIKRPMLPQKMDIEELEMQMDGAKDDDELGKVIQRQLDDAWLEQALAFAYAVDHEDEVSQHAHEMNHLKRQQDEVEQGIWLQRRFPHPQSPTPSVYASTIVTEAEPVYDRQEGRPFRRGPDNLLYYEPDVVSPETGETPPLPAFSPSAILDGKESCKNLQYVPSVQALSLQCSSQSDDGNTEVTRHWDWEITALQKVELEAPENSFKMQAMRQNHSASDFGQTGEFSDDTRSFYEPPPPSPTDIGQPRQGEFQSRVDQMVRGPPLSPPFSPANTSSHSGQVSSLQKSHEYDDDRALTSPRPGMGRAETSWSQMPTFVNSESQGNRDSHGRDRSETLPPSTIFNSRPQPNQSFEGSGAQARSAGPSRRDSSHGLRDTHHLPDTKISRLNRFLVRLLGDPTFDESVGLWDKIQERLDSGKLKLDDTGSDLEDLPPTSRFGRF